MAKFTTLINGYCAWEWQKGQAFDDNKFKRLDISAFNPIDANNSMTTMFVKNYNKCIINKILMVFDQFEMDVSYMYGYNKDADGKPIAPTKPGDFNMGKCGTENMYFRYRFCDADVNQDIPKLSRVSSETIGFKTFKKGRHFRIKKTIYPRCKKTMMADAALLNRQLFYILQDMGCELYHPAFLFGHGMYSDFHKMSSPIRQMVTIGFRMRYYVFWTFSGKLSNDYYNTLSEFTCNVD